MDDKKVDESQDVKNFENPDSPYTGSEVEKLIELDLSDGDAVFDNDEELTPADEEKVSEEAERNTTDITDDS